MGGPKLSARVKRCHPCIASLLMVTPVGACCNRRSQTGLVSTFCYWYIVSTTILIPFFFLLKTCVHFFGSLCISWLHSSRTQHLASLPATSAIYHRASKEEMCSSICFLLIFTSYNTNTDNSVEQMDSTMNF